MVRRLINFLGLLLCVVLLASTLALGWSLPTAALTLPGLSSSGDDLSTESNIPVFTRGNLEIAPVFLDGRVIGTVESFIALRLNRDGSETSYYSAATRSYLIHSKLQNILDNMTRYSQQVLQVRGISQVDEQERELRKQLVTTISEKNGNKVVLATFPRDNVPQQVYMVTPATIARPRFGGSQPLQIAERAANTAKNAMIQAWKERQTPHRLSQARRGLLVLVALVLTSLSLGWMQKRLDSKKRRLNNSLSRAEALGPQSNSASNPQTVTVESEDIAFWVERKLSLNQSSSLNAFYREGLFWTQSLVWMVGIGYLTSLFYWTRPLSNWIVGVTIRGAWSLTGITNWPPFDWLITFGRRATLGRPLFILLLLLAARLTLTGGDALSDFLARHWSEKQSSQRQGLRIPTLARAFKGWLRVVVYLSLGVTLVYLLHRLGTITQAVAVFLGVFSFALSLASQDVLRDLIAGLLILWEDQYAVGDVVVIKDQGGLVEKITLRVTQLRNLDGELITIPNRSIEMVRNLSSDWSRVNYAIEVGYDADVDRALEVIEAVAQQMYGDPQWQEQILEAPEILGVDNISHTGILIRLIIKTPPLQQWAVAREFRRRLKKAFDEQGIRVGIPQQMMYVNQPFPKMSNGNLENERRN